MRVKSIEDPTMHGTGRTHRQDSSADIFSRVEAVVCKAEKAFCEAKKADDYNAEVRRNDAKLQVFLLDTSVIRIICVQKTCEARK